MQEVWQWLLVLAAVVGELLAIVFVLRVLSRGGSPSSTLLWMGLILVAPYLGLLLYYMLPRRVQMARLRRRQNRLAWIEGELDELVPSLAASDRGEGRPLHRLLLRLDPEGLHGGNAVALQSTGREFFADAAEAIAGAREFVHFETYIFRPDDTGLRLLGLLAAAARRGVEVRLLYDSFGSWGLKSRHLKVLREAGGKAEAYLPLLWRRRPFTLNLRNHRKLLVVDNQVAFLGGRNVGDEYARDRFGKSRLWLDAMVRVAGPAVTRLHRIFVEDWYNTTEEDLVDRRYFPEPPAAAGGDTLGVVASGPDRSIHALSWVLFQLVAMAEESIDISSPYLIPPPTLLLSLQVAAGRGVRVRIHSNGREAEQFILYRAQRGYYRALLDAGVEITETRGDYNHTKLLVVDRKHMLVGSANLDMRSAELNFELGVVVLDSPVAAEAVDLLDERCRSGAPVRREDLPQSAAARVVEGICRVLSPLL